ncbi:hypothetical protein PTKIN_Ptkin18bG0033000 [Pterospermum kingtungense]
MEKAKRNQNLQRFLFNLKTLPPLDPSIIPPLCQDKYENPSSKNEAKVARPSSIKGTKLVEFGEVPRKADMGDKNLKLKMEDEQDFCLSSTKLIDPNSTKDFNFNRENEFRHKKLGFKDR